MKKTIILGCLFLAFVSISAQEKGQKNTTPIKDTKINTEVSNKQEKTIKVVVVPVSDVNYQTSTKSAIQATSKFNSLKPEKTVVNSNKTTLVSNNTLKPEKPVDTEKSKKEKTLKKEKNSK